MEVSQVVNLISNLGFPIAVSIALFWLVLKVNDNFNETIKELRSTIDRNSQLIDDMLDTFKERNKNHEL